MSRSQERTIPTPTSSSYTFSTTVQYAPNAISTNKEGTQCVAGGRNLLKVFYIEEKRFTERVNLVVGPQNLNYSIVDVQWHPLEENLIASAAGNGVVILWDLNKVNESKKDYIFRQHYRYVTKLCFHPTDSNLLISSSHDGNINCFDIRKKEVAYTFAGRTDSIRDVQFHPSERGTFCAACDSGNIQLWDIRRPDQYINHFQAHSGPAFTLNWHPDDKYWLATGGRDNSIKVWDTCVRGPPIHVIHTIAPVHRIKWRPHHKYHIASCALVLDNNLNIWDIRRPYIPFAAFQEAKEAVTGIVWQKDAEVMIACSKDKHIYHQVMAEAERPAEKANPVALSISPQGYVAHTYPNMAQKATIKSKTPFNSFPSTPVKKSSLVSQEFKTDSSILRFVKTQTEMEESYIARLATKYKFHGMPFGTICDHNAKVSSEENFPDKAGTWIILKQLYLHEGKGEKSVSSPASEAPHIMMDNYQRKLDTPESLSDANTASHALHSNSSDEERSGFHTPSSLKRVPVFTYQTLVGPELDAVFNDDYNTSFYATEFHGAEDEQLDSLPSEAFQLRQQFNEKAILPVKESQDDENDVDERTDNFECLLTSSKWQYENIVQEMVYYYAEQGDLQMSVTVLLTLRNHIGRDLIDLNVQDEWFNGYLELLYSLRLFNIATEIINHAPIPVNSLNQNSTSISLKCGSCDKSILKRDPGWYCKTCQKVSQVCSICHVPVKGLYVWCQGCGHGGHLYHLMDWFEKKTMCPTGCGHHCQYT